jgi:hypothetical protein
MSSLDASTRGGRDYEDPWKPKQKKKKKKAAARQKPVKKKTVRKNVVSDAISTELCVALESVRRALNDAGVSTRFDAVVDEKSIEAMLKDQGLTGKSAVYQLDELSRSADRYDYFELLIPEYGIRIDTEPFDGYEESEINAVYKDAWKAVGKAIAHHCTIDSVRTRKKKIEDGVFDIDVTIKASGKKLEYSYEVVDSRIDDTIYADFADCRQELALPWRFYFDKTYSESEVFVFYLPESAKQLLLGYPTVA